MSNFPQMACVSDLQMCRNLLICNSQFSAAFVKISNEFKTTLRTLTPPV